MTPIFELSFNHFPTASEEGARTDGITLCVSGLIVGTDRRAAQNYPAEHMTAFEKDKLTFPGAPL